ncbi:hypothetical protein WJX84_009704 [Apatococcus fuscideae]|uniref:Expansin-like EG45 domain-containing protein n=1 Tax=Apatococcus fuscideae TaxID=2026836 RepID=A0AAW1T013_9CHLO
MATLRTILAGPLSAINDGTAIAFGSSRDSVTTEPTSGPLANGSCGYGKRQLAQWPYLNVTAIAANNSLALLGLPKAGCGICIQITCSDQASCQPQPAPIIVQNLNTCLDCAEDELQVHASALSQLSPTAKLPLDIQFQQVDCVPPSDMAVSLTKYAMEPDGNAAVQLSMEQVAGSNALTSIELQVEGSGGFTEMTNPFGAAWQLDNVSMPPYDLRITSQDGQQVVAMTAVPFAAAARFPTIVQFGTSDRFGQGVTQVAAAPGFSKESPTAENASPPTPASPSLQFSIG